VLTLLLLLLRALRNLVNTPIFDYEWTRCRSSKTRPLMLYFVILKEWEE
jgi:hypothetical protein